MIRSPSPSFPRTVRRGTDHSSSLLSMLHLPSAQIPSGACLRPSSWPRTAFGLTPANHGPPPGDPGGAEGRLGGAQRGGSGACDADLPLPGGRVMVIPLVASTVCYCTLPCPAGARGGRRGASDWSRRTEPLRVTPPVGLGTRLGYCHMTRVTIISGQVSGRYSIQVLGDSHR